MVHIRVLAGSVGVGRLNWLVEPAGEIYEDGQTWPKNCQILSEMGKNDQNWFKNDQKLSKLDKIFLKLPKIGI